jgi:putative transcriptional regulator
VTVPPPNFPALAAEASRLRDDLGLSFHDVAVRSGLDKTNVFRLITGQAHGTLKSWHAIAHALEVPTSALVASLDEPLAIELEAPRGSAK